MEKLISGAKKILLVCESCLQADGRAVRFANSLTSYGHDVRGAGYKHSMRSPPSIENSFAKIVDVTGPWDHPLRKYFFAMSMLPGKIFNKLHWFGYWLPPERRRLKSAIENMIAEDNWVPEILIAKHWTALPICLNIAKQTGAKILYDAIEISDAEHDENKKWRILVRPSIKTIEGVALENVETITTIGKGALKHFKNSYPNIKSISVIRNIPDWPKAPTPAKNKKIVITYIGLADDSRSIPDLIESTTQWLPDRELALRLTGSRKMLNELEHIARTKGNTAQIRFEPALPQTSQLQTAVAEADIGIIPFPGNSKQKQLSEPNKLYQYLKSGIPILSTPLERITEIINEHDIGWLTTGANATDFAKAVNNLSIDEIKKKKKNTLKFANSLDWNKEALILKELVDNI